MTQHNHIMSVWTNTSAPKKPNPEKQGLVILLVTELKINDCAIDKGTLFDLLPPDVINIIHEMLSGLVR